jgi:ankyrin repeat protein
MWRKTLVAGVAVVSMAMVLSAAPGDFRLADAAERGDIDTVRSLLATDVDVNSAHGDGMTALHWAAYRNDLDIAQLLTEGGADIQLTTREEALTPLLIASGAGNAALVEFLLEAGADASAANSIGTTALMEAAAAGNLDAVRTLLDHGADTNAKAIRNQTALMFAASRDRAEVIRLLASRGTDLNSTSAILPMDLPLFDDDGNRIPNRTSGGRPKAEIMGGNTALHYAVREGHVDAVRALVAAGVNINERNPGDLMTPMVMAIVNGEFDIANYLLGQGADPNMATIDGLAALYATIDMRYAPVAWSPTRQTAAGGIGQRDVDYLEFMEILLEHGAETNVQLVKALWFRPPHHNQMWVSAAGSTPFWRAAQANDLPAMKLLVAYGSDPNLESIEGNTALAMATGIGWLGNFALNHADGYLPAIQYLVEELGVRVETRDTKGYTPLMGAAHRGDSEIVEYLVEHGADLQARTELGWAVTDLANGPYIGSSVRLSHPDTVALLLEMGAPSVIYLGDEEILGVIKRQIEVTEDGYKEKKTGPQ